jgi:phage terminase large subunit
VAFGPRIDEGITLLGTTPHLDQNLDKEVSLEEAALYYLDHPVDWAADMLGITYDPWQAEGLNALVKSHFVSVRSGHGVGKSCFMATTLLWFLTTHPFCKIIATAPTKEQLFDVLWAECSRWIRESQSLSAIIQWTQEKIYMKAHPEEWWAVARTAEVRKLGKTGLVVAESMQGRHAENMLYLLDEASGIDEAIMETVDGALTTENCYVVMAGNPTRPLGTFFDSHNTKRRLWHTIHVNSEDSPRVTQSFITRMLDKCNGNREDPLYLIRVRGEFPPAQHNQLYPLYLIEKCCVNEVRGTDYDNVEIGVDVARYGGDNTVFCVRRGPQVIKIQQFPQQSTMETAGRVIQFIREYRPSAVKIDVVGVGAGVYDRLIELKYAECLPFSGGNSPQDKDRFVNLRAETHWNLRDLIEKNAIKLPGHLDKSTGHIVSDDSLVGQMTNLTYSFNSKGKILIESKEDLKKRGVKSPDRLDAVVMAFADATSISADVGQPSYFTYVPMMGR